MFQHKDWLAGKLKKKDRCQTFSSECKTIKFGSHFMIHLPDVMCMLWIDGHMCVQIFCSRRMSHLVWVVRQDSLQNFSSLLNYFEVSMCFHCDFSPKHCLWLIYLDKRYRKKSTPYITCYVIKTQYPTLQHISYLENTFTSSRSASTGIFSLFYFYYIVLIAYWKLMHKHWNRNYLSNFYSLVFYTTVLVFYGLWLLCFRLYG